MKTEILKYAIDIPTVDSNGKPSEEMYCVEYFATRKEAIAFAMEHFGADKTGKINLISKIG